MFQLPPEETEAETRDRLLKELGAKPAAEQPKHHEDLLNEERTWTSTAGSERKATLKQIVVADDGKISVVLTRKAGTQTVGNVGRGGTDLLIQYNPNGTSGDQVVGGGSRARPPLIGLYKELFSANRGMQGATLNGPMFGTKNLGEDIAGAEAENELRDQFNTALLEHLIWTNFWKKGKLPQRVVPTLP